MALNIDNNEWLIENGILKEYRGHLKDVIIPNDVTLIGYGAFHNNKLTSVIIPNSVKLIERYAFSENTLINVTISEETEIEETSFDKGVKIIRRSKELTITVEKEETILDKLEKDRQKVMNLFGK